MSLPRSIPIPGLRTALRASSPALDATAFATPLRIRTSAGPHRRHLASTLQPWPSPTSIQARLFSATAPTQKGYSRNARSNAKANPNKPRKPLTRLPSDTDIVSPRILLVTDAEGMTGPHDTNYILRNINLRTHTLRTVAARAPPTSPAPGLPVCKILDKEAEKKKREEQEAAEAEREKLHGKRKLKIVELNWAIAGNDLEMKLRKVREFLEAGCRVEVVMLVKKRAAKKASDEEARALVERVRAVIAGVEGAKEAKPAEGFLGKLMRLFVEKQAKQAPRAAAEVQGPQGTQGTTQGASE